MFQNEGNERTELTHYFKLYKQNSKINDKTMIIGKEGRMIHLSVP